MRTSESFDDGACNYRSVYGFLSVTGLFFCVLDTCVLSTVRNVLGGSLLGFEAFGFAINRV